MFIRTVDEGLARMLRAALALPETDLDIDFSVPDSAWVAARSKPTVDFFLYGVSPSDRPAQALNRRVDQDGRFQRRRTLPVVDLNYLVTTWSADPLAEHELLGAIVSRFAGETVLDPAFLPDDSDSSALLFFGGDSAHRVADIWQTIDGPPRASFVLSVAVAAESYDWTPEAVPVTQVVRSISRQVD